MIEAVDAKWDGALPYTLLVEPDGKIVYAHQGAIDAEELRKIIFNDPMMGRIYYLQLDNRTMYTLRFTGLRDKLTRIRNQTDFIARTFRLK